MKTTWMAAAALAAAMVLTGCETIPPDAERGPNGTMAYDVLIEASPPGARIEAIGESLGNTPVHLKIYGDPDGTFHDFGSYYYEIKAFPLGTNQFPQTKVYMTGHALTPEDRIPQHVYFDMTRPAPPAPTVYYPYGPPPVYYGPPAYYGPEFRVYVGPGYYHRHYRRW